MRELPVRLPPGVDLRRELERLGNEHLPTGAFVLAGIGSLVDPRLRFAGREDESALVGPYELVTLSGTLTPQGAHLHASLSAEDGQVLGGHITYGNVVRTTAEVLLVELAAWSLTRVHDTSTGFLELKASSVNRGESAA